MRTITPRVLVTMMALLALSLGTTGTATAQDDDEHMLDLPVQLAYCDDDPGNRLQPGGGKYVPEEEMARFNCDPAVGVDVTVYNLDIDFFDRCTTEDDGICRVNAPTDPERELMVAIHMTTVSPGSAPHDVVNPTVHFTEFTGIGIALFSDPDITPGAGDAEERTTIAANVAVCEDGSNAEGCEREPTDALVQASSGDITAEGAPWLATNDEGWVSFDRDLLEGDAIDLMLQTDTEPRFACSDEETGDRLDTEWIEGREGNFIRVTATTEANITCDITLLDQQDR